MWAENSRKIQKTPALKSPGVFLQTLKRKFDDGHENESHFVIMTKRKIWEHTMCSRTIENRKSQCGQQGESNDRC